MVSDTEPHIVASLLLLLLTMMMMVMTTTNPVLPYPIEAIHCHRKVTGRSIGEDEAITGFATAPILP